MPYYQTVYRFSKILNVYFKNKFLNIFLQVQIIGAWKALPLLKHQPGGLSTLGGSSPFLLNPQVTLVLYILSCLLILASSLVLYLYGHTR